MAAAASSWEEALRKMLPPGAPLPDEDHLDYSISVEYDGPPIPYEVPRIKPLENRSSSSSSSAAALPRGSRFARSRCADPPRGAATESARSSSAVLPQPDSDGAADASSASASASPPQRGPETTTKPDLAAEPPGDPIAGASPPRPPSSSSPAAAAAATGGGVGRRGACARCGKGGILREREACLACGARYCGDCVLRAMGSMPEGRKCVGCIGRPIAEPKRSALGKSSRMLSKLFSPREVQQIMKAERECAANQLRPGQLTVNGHDLTQEELDEILGCPNPPQKLRPGRYWYDKDSGLWGKEGEKPDQIISSKLNVGGKLQPDASNGNTQVFINGREITKLELRVLKLANVQCPRGTHFWVYDDGSYEEEGQNIIRGKIWEKASTRLICSLFSLPTPPENTPGLREDASAPSSRLIPEYLEQRRVQKLLLLGLEGSGSSTIFKQAKFLYGSKFSAEEMQSMKLMIQSNLYKYLSILLEGREQFEDEALEEKRNRGLYADESHPSEESEVKEDCSCIYSINQRLKHFSDWLLEIVAMGDLDAFFPAATREYAPVVEEIWRDPAIQETYKRRNELHSLPNVAGYFLDKAIEVSSNEYEPTEKDILYAEGVTDCHGLVFLEFSLDDQSMISDPPTGRFDCPSSQTKYQLIRVDSKGLNEGCRWLEMFEDIRAVIFCVSLSDYDQMWPRDSGDLCNKMILSKELFENIVNHPSFQDTPFVLLLNKYDTFEEKIDKIPLTVCEWFSDFSPVKPHHTNQSLASHAYYFIAVKFKDLYASLCDRKLFVFQMKALERSTIDDSFKYIREVLKWDDMKDDNVFAVLDESFYTTDATYSNYLRQDL
ncbi:extra-large guanine nucleotide-binding protein 3-like isoform X2 [Ananas comosus]|uniref:Extra-large guanine nucleotide-binding protein 3-like isoform X2 n=1 Tax=Ananas comosus TaxID=4615 RepID=A0A6P5GGR2_ANACO|nr:extra-large guanine nucleotide-binding protein 3-like isoform X2 [Ananas comosus]